MPDETTPSVSGMTGTLPSLQTSTGYGPSPSHSKLYFSGEESGYELWEIKFFAKLRIQRLIDVIESASTRVDSEKNKLVFAELVQLLDDKSLSLIIRDAKDDGRKAIEILREHYVGCSKPRIISLYTVLTNLHMSDNETITDYILRAEKAATSLKTAGEAFSDSLLIAMVMKGLPLSYMAFSTVITQQREETTFSDFKSRLRAFEENEKVHTSNTDDGVNKIKNFSNDNIICYNCDKPGHKSPNCPDAKNSSKSGRKGKFGGNCKSGRPRRWCEICNNRYHI